MQAFLTKLGVPIARKDGQALAKLLVPDVKENAALKILIQDDW